MSYAVRTEALGRSFGATEALNGLDLAVEPGTVLGLLGHNGAGKTTAVRILTTLLSPTTGHAEVAGRDVRREPHAVRERIAVAGQEASLDERLTGRENLMLIGRLQRLGRRDAARRTDELLDRFGIAHAADRQVGTYSGGMRRRLDLAACLMLVRPVVFLDEPTTGLDPSSRAEMWEAIAGLVNDGAALILTTQYLEEADRLADRIVVLRDGRTVAAGSPLELKRLVGDQRVHVTVGDFAAAAERLSHLEPDLDPRIRRLTVPAPDGPDDLRGVLDLLDDIDVEEADRLADDIVVLSQGRTVAAGTPAELKARVGDRRVHVGLPDADAFAGAARLFERLEPELDVRARRLTLPAPDGPRDLRAVLDALEIADVAVEEVSLSQPTLDDAFFALAGEKVT